MNTSRPENYPRDHETSAVLKNGATVFIRPVVPDDGPLLKRLFNRLSPRSVYYRFLGNLRELSEEMIYHFTHMDYREEYALAALINEGGRDAVIAVGRYAHVFEEGTTDLALAVRDDWQGSGLGTLLLERVINAGRKQGYTRYRSMMDPDNTAMRHILLRLGYKVRLIPREGYFVVDIDF